MILRLSSKISELTLVTLTLLALHYTRSKLSVKWALCQMGSCMSYASKFQELLIYVNFSEAMKIHKFYEGLKDDVKDIIVTILNITHRHGHKD